MHDIPIGLGINLKQLCPAEPLYSCFQKFTQNEDEITSPGKQGLANKQIANNKLYGEHPPVHIQGHFREN